METESNQKIDIKIEQRIDPYSGKLFTPKRSNQYFENRKNQNNYNNNKARKKREARGSIDSSIIKNYDILVGILYDEPSARRSKDYLLGAGYCFKYSHYLEKIGNKEYAITYHIGISEITEDEFEIIDINTINN
jgi:hypothetical protein